MTVAITASCQQRDSRILPPESPQEARFQVLRIGPDPRVIKDAKQRSRIMATGSPWRVRHRASGIEMVLIPAGSYMRGAPSRKHWSAPDERPRHRVMISKPFYLGVTEVTNAQFRNFWPDHNSSYMKGISLDRESQPVVEVSWKDAQAYCAHYGLRLPTEGEWEYACRAGTPTLYPWGQETSGGQMWANVLDTTSKLLFRRPGDSVPWDDGYRVSAPVAWGRPNGFGLYDIIGNVWEFCQDRYDPREYWRHVEGVVDPRGAASGGRVMRGGSWASGPAYYRSSTRFVTSEAMRTPDSGFRVACDLRARTVHK